MAADLGGFTDVLLLVGLAAGLVWWYYNKPTPKVEQKTGKKFNWHTRHNCDICRTIFTDKSILSILRDNVFEADSMPLLFYHCKAKTENERRTKQ